MSAANAGKKVVQEMGPKIEFEKLAIGVLVTSALGFLYSLDQHGVLCEYIDCVSKQCLGNIQYRI